MARLNQLDAISLANGFRLAGIDAYDRSGVSVAGAGDVNGDGIDDLIIGAYSADPDGKDSAGESYVVFGRDTGLEASLDLTALDGSNGFRLDGIDADDYSGGSVAGAGDVNGDGIGDLIVGAPLADPNGKSYAGESYVVFGTDASFPASLDLSALDGSNGFRLDGIDADDRSGGSVAGAGDVNGDGIGDLLVGAGSASPDGKSYAGESYVVFGTAAGFDASFDLAALDGSNGFRLDGIDAGDYSGRSVAGAGDVNGDGIDDLIVGASLADPDGRNYGGESYVVFGTDDGFAASLDLSALDGSNGFRLDGIDADDQSGHSVAGAGDVNGDGIDDLIIGAFGADADGESYAGESYVVFGTDTGFAASLDLAALDGTNGFRLDGSDADDSSGFSVAGAGDINGDGIDDLIVGAPGAGVDYAGESYVVFGRASGFAASLDLAALDFTDGLRLAGIDAFDESGRSVAGAGDVNGDGIDDLIIGAPFANPGDRHRAGESYVIYGSTQLGGINDAPLAADDLLRPTPFEVIDLAGDNGAGADRDPDLDDLTITAIDGTPVSTGDSVTFASGLRVTVVGPTDVRFDAPGVPLRTSLLDSFVYEVSDGRGGSDTATVSIEFTQNTISLADLDGSNGFRLDGIDAGDESGTSVAGAGDVNGDGIDDLIIGARFADPGDRNAAGESYVVFGTTAGFDASLDLSALDGSNGFRLDGIEPNDETGFAVAGAGDVNGDGIDDLIVGAPSIYGDDAAGASYVVFGTDSGFTGSLDLGELDGSNGFRIDGEGITSYGHSVDGAGDVNGDGFDDVIVGTRDYHNQGPSYVVFGSAAGIGASIDLATLDGTNGFSLSGGVYANGAGFSVSGAGDINGDGIDDLIVGAWIRYNYAAGESYVVFGTDTGFAANLDLATLDGSNGFRINGVTAGPPAGDDILSVAGAGDVNGDGIDDVIVATPGFDKSYVVFGTDAGFEATLDLADLDGTNGFRLVGAGDSVAGAGDFNGDGFDDLIIGAPYAGTGASYVVFGSAAGFAASIDLAALDGTDGFRLDGIDAGDYSGRSVAGAGDVNGDGFDDLIIGAPLADPGGRYNAGESYVVFGFGSVIFTQQADVRDLNRFDLADFANTTRALGGDDTVVLSETQNLGVAFFGGAGDDSIAGSRRADDIRGGTGDDDLRGRMGGDALAGGSGDDALAGGTGRDALVGGQGRDTLFGGWGDDALAGGTGDDALVGAGGRDALFGGRGDDALAGGTRDDRLLGGTGRDTLFGGWGDDMLVGGAGPDTLAGGHGDDRFDFNGTTDSPLGAGRDLIRGFDNIGRATGDRIDLVDIDAIAGGRDTPFDFIGTAGFSARGQLRVFNQNGNTVIAGNTAGDLRADFQIVVDDGITAASAWREADFLL